VRAFRSLNEDFREGCEGFEGFGASRSVHWKAEATAVLGAR
jgi:hypothetical protein